MERVSFLNPKYIPYLLLTGIIFFSSVVRLYQLDSNPPGFFSDEASIGYNAYTILTAGTDEYNKPFPVFFRAFGEFKGPIQIYSTVFSIALFGLNEFATRLPSVLYGVGTILALFFLVRELSKNLPHSTTIALFAAFFLAITPWHFHLSRIAFEQNPYLFFTVLGTYFLLKARSHIHLFYLSVFFFSLGIYSYFPARIFIPLFSVSFFLIFIKSFHRHKKHIFFSTVLGIVLLLPLLFSSLTGDSLSRWQQVSIFKQQNTQVSVWEHIATNYISHFSIDFLFTKGDSGMPGQFITRHSLRGYGQLYIFQSFFILAGFLYLLLKKQYRIFTALTLWLLFYPTGSMFTLDESAQATRSVIGVLPLQILIALGVVGFVSVLFKRHIYLRLTSYSFIFLMSIYFFYAYFQSFLTTYPQYAADFWGWQYGAKHIVHTFTTYQDEYDLLVMAPEFNAPEIFFRFYAPDGCDSCVVGLPEDQYLPSQKQLFAITPQTRKELKHEFILKEVIFYPNNTVAFLIGEIVE